MSVDVKLTVDIELAVKWCSEHISPVEFYIHTATGGRGWKIVTQRGQGRVIIEDSELAVLYVLSNS